MYRRLSEEVVNAATRKAPFNAYFHYAALSTPETLTKAESEARAVIASVGARTGKFVHGWSIAPLVNAPEDSFHPVALLDSQHKPRDGANARYKLTFPANGLPPAGAFRSVAMYSSTTSSSSPIRSAIARRA